MVLFLIVSLLLTVGIIVCVERCENGVALALYITYIIMAIAMAMMLEGL